MSVHVYCIYQTFMPTAVTARMLANFRINSTDRFVWETLNDTFDTPDSTKIHKDMVQ